MSIIKDQKFKSKRERKRCDALKILYSKLTGLYSLKGEIKQNQRQAEAMISKSKKVSNEMVSFAHTN